MAIDRALNMISMAMKAGRLVSGEFACEQAIKEGSGVLCIVAKDASDNTKKSFYCQYLIHKSTSWNNERLGN